MTPTTQTATVISLFVRTAVVAAAVICAPTSAARANIVVPNSFAATVGGAQSNKPDSNLTFSYQWIIDASQFAGVNVGDQITGVYWRALSSSTQASSWPPAGGASWTNFDMYLSTAATTPASASNTFALNEGGDKISVLAGAYSIAAGAYTNPGVTGTVSPWGPLVSFSSPFTYNGGGLTLTLRQKGNNTGTAFLLDAIAPTNTAAGYGTLFTTRATVSGAVGDYTATTGAATALVITQFQVTSAPAPSAAALLGLGGLVAARRRRCA